MSRLGFETTRLFLALAAACLILNGCGGMQADSRFFGKTVAPTDNVLRYVSGAAIETLDPQIPDGQPDARIHMALYDGLVEYHPKDLQPIPAIAKSWEGSPNVDEFIFHLRDNAKWSDGKPITARDFVYSFRRGFAPDTLSRTANLGYFVKYSEAFNGGQVFAKKGDQFLLAKDFGGAETEPQPTFGPETEFNKFLKSPDRLLLPGDEKKRSKKIESDPKLKAALEGAEFVPVKGEDIGVEAIDDFTLRITLKQSAPFFLGLLAHQFFRLVPQHAIEKHGKLWTRPENIVTCGAFKVKQYRPYDRLIVEKDPIYWDAKNVHLSAIEFYPVEELSTILNLYKAGTVDAFLNHVVLSSWIDEVRRYKDEYMNFPEAAVSYYGMNVTRAPFDNPKVRRAFTLAVDRVALANFRKTTKPLFAVTPKTIFPDYDRAMAKVGEELRSSRGMTEEQWANNYGFDPEQARKLLGEAGFRVEKNGEDYSNPSFPAAQAELVFNTGESNRAIAEFVQSQWKRHLGVTVQLKNMEFKSFLPYKDELQYPGFSQLLWSADYMDPFTFLSLFYTADNSGDTGWVDPKFDQLLDEANAELDVQKRNEKLARAEYYVLDNAIIVPLTANATNWMKKPYVKGLYPNAATLLPWKFVYIETDTNKWDRDIDNVMADTDPRVAAQLNELTSTLNAAADE